MTQYIEKFAILAEIDRLQKTTMDENGNFLSSYHEGIFNVLSMLEYTLDTLEVKEKNEGIKSNDLEEAAWTYYDKNKPLISHELDLHKEMISFFIAGAQWQKDHTCFAGRTKTIEEIKEALLSEVLPCFMHGGEADEVVAKLDEVLNQK